MDAPAQPDNRPTRTDARAQNRAPLRLFLYEPGWGVGLKVGSERVFCYMMAPGQDFYHRLLDGELYLYNHEERICFACAERRGLISLEPRSLREPLSTINVVAGSAIESFPLLGEDGDPAFEDLD